MLVARCAVLASLCTDLEARALIGNAINVPDYINMAATLARLLRMLGLRRVPKEVESLSVYLGNIDAKQSETKREEAA